MPLRDHFHSPWADANPWEGFHSAWANTLVRHLNGSLLPSRFRAIPQVRLGARPAQTLAVDYPDQDVCEVQVLDEKRGMRLVGGRGAVAHLAPVAGRHPAGADRPGKRL